MEPSESKKKLAIILLILIFIIGIFYFFTYQKKHTDWVHIQPQISLSVQELLQNFQNGEGNDLINKVVQISGTITALDDSLYILDKAVVCKPAVDIESNITEKEFVIVKGRCVGYDDLLMEVRLDHVVVTEL